MQCNTYFHGPRSRARAFSLVELMVVVGIITLLIAIALPAFAAARRQARVASTSAAISAIATGCDMFRADTQLGGQYPISYFWPYADPHNSKTPSPTGDTHGNRSWAGGANVVVWQLAGADLQGPRKLQDYNLNGDGSGGLCPWADDTGNNYNASNFQASGAFAINPDGKPVHPTGGSFVDASKVKTAKPITVGSKIKFRIGEDQQLDSICFVDPWNQPILYYRANVGRTAMAWDNTADDFQNENYPVYNRNDNSFVTNPTTAMLGGPQHFSVAEDPDRIRGVKPVGVEPPRASSAAAGNSFSWTIYNPNSTVWAPHNPETYILLSAGPDEIFGTPDDVANFPTNK